MFCFLCIESVVNHFKSQFLNIGMPSYKLSDCLIRFHINFICIVDYFLPPVTQRKEQRKYQTYPEQQCEELAQTNSIMGFLSYHVQRHFSWPAFLCVVVYETIKCFDISQGVLFVSRKEVSFVNELRTHRVGSNPVKRHIVLD